VLCIPIMLLLKKGISFDCVPLQSLWKDVPADGAAEEEDEEDADFTVDLDQMLADADAAAAQSQARRSWRGDNAAVSCLNTDRTKSSTAT